MPQFSKLIQSRKSWKNKAIQRATENREQRKQTKLHQKKIGELKTQVKELKDSLTDKKNVTENSTDRKHHP